MKVKELDELENQLNQIIERLDNIESLSRILLNCIRRSGHLKPCDVESLTSVLKEKVIKLKERIIFIEENLWI